MKRVLFTLIAMTAIMTGCGKDDGGNGGNGGNDMGLVFVEGDKNWIGTTDKEWVAPLANYTLDADKVYHLRGWVHIPSGATLTIPAGTIIKGTNTTSQPGASLIIERGAKIFSNGTASKPVVFTSSKDVGERRPGDWGGIIILGKASNNAGGNMKIEGGVDAYHGGTDDNDNSGIIRYTRIEFAGAAFNSAQSNSEINGLTLGSVGSGTQIDHVQVSYSCDDSYEWFGGSLNAKYLVAYHGWDDDFDTDNGFSGTLQFLLGVRNPKIADQSNSNGFESDNNAGGSVATPYTKARFSNVTLVGPIGQMASFTNTNNAGGTISWTPGTDASQGPFQAALHIRRKSHISISNSVVFGYPIGLMLDCNGNADAENDSQNFAVQNNTLKDVVFAGYDVNLVAGATFDNTAVNSTPLLGCDKNSNWKNALCTDGSTVNESAKSFSFEYLAQANATRNNVVLPTIAELLLEQPISFDGTAVKSGQNYGPKSGSPLIKSALVVPAGFDAEGNGYYGAFRSSSASDNWLANWTNFDPQNTVY